MKTEVFGKSKRPFETVLAQTTHMAIGAHPDDLEIMAYSAIEECHSSRTKWFTGVVVTDGAGSPRSGRFAKFSDSKMKELRQKEQQRAARLGHYLALAQLEYSSAVLKTGDREPVIQQLAALLKLARPQCLFLHNLADKHDTHVAVGLCSIEALRRLNPEETPRQIWGCEIWRNLDWLGDSEKGVLPSKNSKNLSNKLLKCHASQVVGGKRYDLAVQGRRKANAIFYESGQVDMGEGLDFAMDLTPLAKNREVSVEDFVAQHIRNFEEDVRHRLRRFR